MHPPTKIKKSKGTIKSKKQKNRTTPKTRKKFFYFGDTGTYQHNRIGVRCGSLKFFRLKALCIPALRMADHHHNFSLEQSIKPLSLLTSEEIFSPHTERLQSKISGLPSRQDTHRRVGRRSSCQEQICAEASRIKFGAKKNSWKKKNSREGKKQRYNNEMNEKM